MRRKEPGGKGRGVRAAVDPAKFRALAELSKQLGVWNVPTMYLWENFYNDRTPEELAAFRADNAPDKRAKKIRASSCFAFPAGSASRWPPWPACSTPARRTTTTT